MRTPGAYYLMLLYIIIMVKPLLPLIDDSLAHTFAEAAHIATVHAVYGSNHLQKDLSKAAAENSTNKHQAGSNTEDQVPFHLSVKECIYNFSSESKGDSFYALIAYNLTSGFLSRFSPPPKFC